MFHKMVIHGFTLRNRGHLSVCPLQKDFIKYFILKKKKKTEKCNSESRPMKPKYLTSWNNIEDLNAPTAMHKMNQMSIATHDYTIQATYSKG